MTLIIGVLCSDGVVLGADGATTLVAGNQYTIRQPTSKLHILNNAAILGGTGAVGFGQRFQQVASNGLASKKGTASHLDIGRSITQAALADAASTRPNNFPPAALNTEYGALLAFHHAGKAHLCEFQLGNMQPEFKTDQLWYAAMGSGQVLADPFLALVRNLFWKDGPPRRSDAAFAITWALTHAIGINPGGLGDPICIAELYAENGKPVARIIPGEELDEHKENVRGLERYIGDYPSLVTNGGVNAANATAAPILPSPP
jgi:hypothetical protein